MLFKFGKFWETTLAIAAAWILYAITDFEFTVITLLAILIVVRYSTK
jgi:hypothetical protein